MTEHSSPCRLQWQKHRISFPGVHGSAVVSTGQMVPRALPHIWEPGLLKRTPGVSPPLRGCGDCCKGWGELRSVVSLRKRSLWKTRHLFLILRIISRKRNQVNSMFYEIPTWSWKLQVEKINSKKNPFFISMLIQTVYKHLNQVCTWNSTWWSVDSDMPLTV